jgi:hypothetical protein
METKKNSLDSFFERIFVVKAPFQLPESVKEWIVKYSPWITVVALILMAPAILAAIGLGAAFSGLILFGGLASGGMYYISMIVGILEIVLLLIALPGLFKRKLSAWKLVYYSSLLSTLVGVVTDLVYVEIGSLIVTLICGAISLYIIFQVKSKYA